MKKYLEISSCRVCGGELKPVGSLGEHYINDFPKEWPHTGDKAPIDLVSCQNCDLLQLKHSVSPEILYKDGYWYKSGINPVIVDDLKEIAEIGIRLSGANDGDIILSIGENDGSLLKNIPDRFIRVAIEPARNFQNELKQHANIVIDEFWSYEGFIRTIQKWAPTLAQGQKRSLLQNYSFENAEGKTWQSALEQKRLVDRKWIQSDFSPEKEKDIRASNDNGKIFGKKTEIYGNSPSQKRRQTRQSNRKFRTYDSGITHQSSSPKAKVIFAIGMFYDLDDPNEFIADVQMALVPDGIFIAQLMTLKPMIKNNDVGNLCHEHLEHYSYKNLVYLFEANGLEIFKVEENKINGGSYRLFARHYRNGSIDYLEPEFDYKIFFEKIHSNKNKVMGFLREAKDKGKRVYGYGASTKFNTILQFYGLGPEFLDGVADANSIKWGSYTLTGVPIVSEEEGRKNADYFLIGPWGFTEFFSEREKEWLKNGGRFISHTPDFSIF